MTATYTATKADGATAGESLSLTGAVAQLARATGLDARALEAEQLDRDHWLVRGPDRDFSYLGCEPGDVVGVVTCEAL